jgi:hypothetical protein
MTRLCQTNISHQENLANISHQANLANKSHQANLANIAPSVTHSFSHIPYTHT